MYDEFGIGNNFVPRVEMAIAMSYFPNKWWFLELLILAKKLHGR
jgi:hypothetical protein